MSRKNFVRNLSFALAMFGAGAANAATTGTLTTAKGTVAVKYAYVVKGPDTLSGSVIKKLILTSADIAAKLKACDSTSCVDGAVTEGLVVDIGGERLNYWFVANNGLTQNSGSTDPAGLKTTADDATHMVGKLSFDGTAMGGPKTEVDFDAAMVKEYTKAR